MAKPTIVVPAYNRPHSLRRLLHSLAAAEYPPDVSLIISIDAGGANGRLVRQAAEQFDWPHGRKQLILHSQHRGLIDHIFFCGDLSQKVGDIILLEDDLVVSPVFYHFAMQALEFYAGDGRIAGIALNALWFNGYTHTPFTPYLDDSDVFFLQIPWFQGQAYSARQWQQFREWRETAVRRITPQDGLHELFTQFPDTDWFPFKTKFLAQTNRFYVFPRQSLTTNFGERGTHFSRPTTFFQVPLQTCRRTHRLVTREQSTAVYDTFQEMHPECLNRLTNKFEDFTYTVDLHGVKSLANITQEYVLTSKHSRAPIFSFGLEMRPMVANVVTAVPGQAIHFSRTADLEVSRRAEWIRESRLVRYYGWGRYGRKKRLKWWLGKQLEKIAAQF